MIIVLGKKRKLENDSLNPEAAIAGGSNLSIQEKENIANYQESIPNTFNAPFNAPSPPIHRNTFNAPSPVRRVFQNLPQISISELMDMEIDDNSNIQAVQSMHIYVYFIVFIKLNIKSQKL